MPRVKIYLQPDAAGEQVEHSHDQVQISRGRRRVIWTGFVSHEPVLIAAHEERGVAGPGRGLDFDVIIHHRC